MSFLYWHPARGGSHLLLPMPRAKRLKGPAMSYEEAKTACSVQLWVKAALGL